MSSIHQPTTVYVVDDSDLIRRRVVTMLSSLDDVTIVGEAADAPEAIDGILARQPDIVLLDLNLGATSGMDVLRAIHSKLPGIRFVVLTNHTEPQYARACLRAGASHFLDKSTQFDSVPALITLHSAGR
jgi:DNA-binding NarL/FixJ family response regulator